MMSSAHSLKCSWKWTFKITRLTLCNKVLERWFSSNVTVVKKTVFIVIGYINTLYFKTNNVQEDYANVID